MKTDGIGQGSTRGPADTDDFVRMVRRLLAGEPRSAGALFEGGGPVFVTRAPGRLDLMGGIADYSGSLVLELPIAAATHAALQLGTERTVVVVSLPPTECLMPESTPHTSSSAGSATVPFSSPGWQSSASSLSASPHAEVI